ncbi:bifunctional 23S rRNA (guanine(2069)-N(7))-methyltransferase RlmK/23S rRNA (guanine(2445)-N(2))-methyltransferase RlmL [Pleionea sediminis]|uniref:bifunctional 23S rRNA (guanine(2069)-N(7))-methyltransferase RlmK/23S rRNA (guanine(2445)-N(2))-methyltransferase RlmL n=1 Tax=Pleionea sediminis TaxID=2569479 RepID=UPI0011869F8E|nr:bifunctional 23S rRNA (guanine(2069)-N(7))-methyltransferase RlmK/23S rRNA (guanine(2445)-N(2))-methyltransferase RlmL [Pleionea sediminis]
MPQFIVTCPPGFEYLLVDELNSLGEIEVREGLTQVFVDCDWQHMYRICLWSRLAHRVLYPIAEFEARDEDALYEAVYELPWELHFSEHQTFAVDFVSRRSTLKHQQYGALKIKDAIVDYFRENFGERPSVDTEMPDVRIHCRMNKNKAHLCIDLSGKSLHQRGYREKTGEAPIKENFAAAMLYRSGWASSLANKSWLYDPMCGSGTIAIEAVLMATDRAPGLGRNYWGFTQWKRFDEPLWQAEVDRAKERNESAKAAGVAPIFASDKDSEVIAIARNNAERAGVGEYISWEVGAFQRLSRPQVETAGYVVTNPPYGERLEQKKSAEIIYQEFGAWLKDQFIGDKALILSSDKHHGHALGIRAEKIYRLKNGPIDCELLKISVEESLFVAKRKEVSPDNYQEGLSESAKMLDNRIQKNLASLKSFLKQQNISCFRVYDADLPEYAAAIDVYEDCLHIQEYAPPADIDQHKALRRLRDIERVSSGALSVEADRIFVKTRTRQKGEQQYTRQDKLKHIKLVNEGAARFEVNLSDYLDTGLFLDHRKARQLLAKWSSTGDHLLNLFCYTASASVHAAMKGVSTTNVDLSNTYLDWGKRNFQLNGLDLTRHEFIRANCVEWLEQAVTEHAGSYQVIFIDPPTFSNSKKMEKHFDIQKEHVSLLNMAEKLLAPGGRILFSNNFKRFKMEYVPSENVSLREITRETTSRDFVRKPLHRSWVLQKQTLGKK